MSFTKAMIAEIGAVKDILTHHSSYLFRGERSSRWDLSLPTVMLLHGYFVGAPSMKGLANYLKNNGFNVSCENYAFWERLENIELEVSEQLDKICQRTGSKVKIVGHSEGGLVAYALAQKFPDNIEKVVSLGSPFKGTYTAYFNYFVPSAKQMVPGSDYLKKLLEQEFPKEVLLFSLYSPYDETIIPRENAKLPNNENMKNICVNNVGHGGLFGKNCYNLIEKILKECYE